MPETLPYLHWGWLQISSANLILIGVMLLAFVVAVIVRMPNEEKGSRRDRRP